MSSIGEVPDNRKKLSSSLRVELEDPFHRFSIVRYIFYCQFVLYLWHLIAHTHQQYLQIDSQLFQNHLGNVTTMTVAPPRFMVTVHLAAASVWTGLVILQKYVNKKMISSRLNGLGQETVWRRRHLYVGTLLILCLVALVLGGFVMSYLYHVRNTVRYVVMGISPLYSAMGYVVVVYSRKRTTLTRHQIWANFLFTDQALCSAVGEFLIFLLQRVLQLESGQLWGTVITLVGSFFLFLWRMRLLSGHERKLSARKRILT